MTIKKARASKARVPLVDLQSHPEAYVTIGELAKYWLVSRKQIYKQIDAGTLPAIRLGPRLLRVGTADALAFERSANMRASVEGDAQSSATVESEKPVPRVRRG